MIELGKNLETYGIMWEKLRNTMEFILIWGNIYKDSLSIVFKISPARTRSSNTCCTTTSAKIH